MIDLKTDDSEQKGSNTLNRAGSKYRSGFESCATLPNHVRGISFEDKQSEMGSVVLTTADNKKILGNIG